MTPEPGTWQIDATGAEVAFVGRHRLRGAITGRFTGLAGAVHIGARPEDSWVTVSIDMASFDFGSATWNELVRASDALRVERHPLTTFRSSAVRWAGTRGTVDGALTMLGTTRPVRLAVDYRPDADRDSDRALYYAVARIDREEFGLRLGMPMLGGNRFVARDVRIEIVLPTARMRLPRQRGASSRAGSVASAPGT